MHLRLARWIAAMLAIPCICVRFCRKFIGDRATHAVKHLPLYEHGAGRLVVALRHARLARFPVSLTRGATQTTITATWAARCVGRCGPNPRVVGALARCPDRTANRRADWRCRAGC